MAQAAEVTSRGEPGPARVRRPELATAEPRVNDSDSSARMAFSNLSAPPAAALETVV